MTAEPSASPPTPGWRASATASRPDDAHAPTNVPPEHVDGIRAPDLKRALQLASAAAAALALSGCEIVDRGDNVVNGKALFIEQCGACHTLARAGTAGTVGPDLDAAFRRAREDGLGAETIAGVVEQQILHPGRRSRMPAQLVTGQDAEDVAAYVAQAAAVPGRDRGRLGDVD